MKVVHHYPVWLVQTATWLYYQVKYLPPSIEPHVVCETTENLDQFPTPNLHSLAEQPLWRTFWDRGMRKLGVRSHLNHFQKVIRRTNAEVVHFHFGPLACRNLTATRGTQARTLVTFYGLDVNLMPRNHPEIREQYRELFRKVDGVLCEGPFMAEQICKLGCPESKVHVHHLGVPLQDFPFRPRVWRPNETMRLLISSSFVEKKGIPFALQAIRQLARETPLALTIIGDSVRGKRDQQEKHRILEQVQTPELQNVTRLTGFLPHAEMTRIAADHHVFLSTSITASSGDTEGGAPVSLIEMAASGMPIISSRHCDIPNVIIDRETGLLSDEKDVGGILDNLRWLAGHPDQWESMLIRGRQRVESLFDCERQGKQLADLYHQLARQCTAIG